LVAGSKRVKIILLDLERRSPNSLIGEHIRSVSRHSGLDSKPNLLALATSNQAATGSHYFDMPMNLGYKNNSHQVKATTVLGREMLAV